MVSGGRYGTIYHVTNLADSGPGSFRDAVSQPNRFIVFDVGGVIHLNTSLVIKSNITIAGQTAPGDGLTLYGAGVSYSGAKNVITRFVRFRMGTKLKVNEPVPTDSAAKAAYDDDGSDAIGISSGLGMIFDHVSVSWGRDGTFDINYNFTTRIIDSITIQNSIISQGLISHSTGGLLQATGHVSILRTLYADNWTRNPKVTCNTQYVNNVLYNWGASSYNFGGGGIHTQSNVVNNYMINGPGGTRPGIMGGDTFVTAYVQGNYWDQNRNGRLDGLEYTRYSDSALNVGTEAIKIANQPFDYPSIANLMTATEAYASVLAHAGASLHRDQVDSLVIADVQSLGTQGVFIRTEDTLSTRGPGVIRAGIAPMDSDQDGMPDAWENSHGLDSTDPSDAIGTTLSPEGYTHREMYVNEIAGDSVVYLGSPVFNSIRSSQTKTKKLSHSQFDLIGRIQE